MNRILSTGLAATLVGTLALGGSALAQQHQGHSGHGAAAATSRDNAATTAYKAANTRMHKDMDIAFTGDADADFVRGMIPHHQGAIDMAKVVLAHGKDPELKKLATSIIADQEKEIAMMREWLKKNGK
ncbi:MAG TPA: DUF305 domain-containing protein [Bosea sp. (in: a-proteobacteria)]